MKKIKMRKLLAVLLSVVMITLQSGPAFAAEGTVSGDEAEEPSEVADESIPEAVEEVSEDAAGAVSEDAAGAVSEDEETARILSYGLNGMSDSYVLSEELRWEKEQLIAHDAVNKVKECVEGVDYIPDEVIFTADNEEFARQVADAYNAEFVSWANGVGKIKLDPEKISVAQAVEVGASNVMSNMVPVNPDYLTRIDDPVATPDETVEDSMYGEAAGVSQIFSANKKTGRLLDWDYWYNTGFKDTYLQPWVRLENADAYQWMHDAVGSYAAWGVTTGKRDVTVAVIDTGVNENSSDLKGKVKTIPGWYTKYDKYEIGDTSSHGTHVAGIIAASGNGVGAVGMAPNVSILAVPVFIIYEDGSSSAPNDLTIEALNKIKTEKLAQVINMSLGGSYYSSTFEAAVKAAHDAGITVCVALGNDNTNQRQFPASYEGAIGVVSTDRDNSRSDFSNYGPNADISAPGSNILSTINGSSEKNPNQKQDLWGFMSGTSMACPVVAGACALYISATGDTDPDNIEKVMKKTATKAAGGMGAGIINVFGMMPDGTEMPGLTAVDQKGQEISTSNLTEEYFLKFTTPETAKGGTIGYVFTFDGTDPKIVDGIVSNGIDLGMAASGRPRDTYPVEYLVNKGMVVGAPATIKVMRISGKGTASQIYTGSITVSGNKADKASGVAVTGPKKVAPGKSVTYKARVYPEYVGSKVKWELRQNPAGVTINAKTGKVTVKKGASGSFKVVAVADDAGKMEGFLDVNIANAASSVTVTAKTDEKVNIPATENGTLKSVRMYTANCADTPALNEKVLQLTAKADNGVDIIYSSSKKSVAEVDENGLITAHKAGNAVITCMASDGSGKKAKIKVKVIVPSSGIKFVYKNGQRFVAYGKSVTINPGLGKAYGNPTVKKAVWSIEEIRGYDSNGSGYKITDQAKSYVKLNNGKVTVGKGINKLGYEMYGVNVKALTSDGTDDWYSDWVYPIPPATIAKCSLDYETGILEFITDEGVFTAVNKIGPYNGINEPVVSASNPKVCGATVIYNKSYPKLANYNDKRVIVWGFQLVGLKTGKFAITVKLNDGSGKKASVSTRVK